MTKFYQRIVLLAAGLFAASFSLHALDQAEALNPGDPLPSGTLHRPDTTAVQLEELTKEKHSILIFYRGGWCPFCRRHLSGLNDIAPELKKAGYQLLAISPDRPEILREKPPMEKAPYQLFSDSSMKVTRSFGIAHRVPDNLVETYKRDHGIDLEGDSGHDHHLLPHPSVYVVGPEGIVRYVHTSPDYKERMDPDKILSVARSLKE